MKLYCWSHNTTHDFTDGQVERIIYALGGAGADDVAAGSDSVTVTPKPACPQAVLRWGRDSEMYAEHVEQGLICRWSTDSIAELVREADAAQDVLTAVRAGGDPAEIIDLELALESFQGEIERRQATEPTSATPGKHEILPEHMARLVAEQLEGQTNLVAAGFEWHFDSEAELDGPRIALTGVADGPESATPITLVLRVESVTAR